MSLHSRKKAAAEQNRPVARVWRWSALILLLWLATFLRVHALDRLPPGLYHDEAFYALDAQHVLHDGRLALFFTGNNGREPLHIYLLAGALGLLGDRVWALRLVGAFSGILAVPLMYRLGSALLRGPGRPGGWAGLLAAAVLTVSYWHLNFSRLVFRAVDLIPLCVLAVWLLLTSARKRSLRLAVFSGLALGLSLYTYTASRLLPFLFLALAAAQFVSHWHPGGVGQALRQPLVRGSVVAVAVAALVFAPLGAYFLTHPLAFSQRSSDVSILGADHGPPEQPDPNLAENALATVRMFVDQGDLHVRHNLPGRPAVDALGLVGFWSGLGVALLTLRQARSQLLLLWLGLLVLPTTLSVDAPHFLRAIGALPAVCLLVADGLLWWWQRLVQRRPRLAPVLWPALVAGVTLFSGAWTYRDYFVRLPLEPTLAGEFNTDIARLAERALALSPEVDVALPQLLFQEPTVLFFLEPVFGALQPVDSQPASGRPAVLLSLREEGLGGLVVLRQGPEQPAAALVTRPVAEATSDTLFTLPRRAGEAASPFFVEIPGVESYLPGTVEPDHPLDVIFAGLFRLRGYDLRPEQPSAGDTVDLDLYWESLRWVPQDYVVSLQLQSPMAINLAQHDAMPGLGHYNTTLWRPGSTFTDPHPLRMPADLPPGKYAVVLGMYEQGSLRRLPLSSASGAAGDSLRVGTLTVPDPELDAAAIPNAVDVVAGDPPLLKLLGYALGPAQPGTDLELTLYWQAQAPLTQDYTVFVHVLDGQGGLRAQQDGPPLEGRAPTSWWAPGEVFRDVHRVSLPADLPPGPYTVAVGSYFWATGERLPLWEGSAQLPDDRWLLPEPLVVGGTTP